MALRRYFINADGPNAHARFFNSSGSGTFTGTLIQIRLARYINIICQALQIFNTE